MDVFEQIKEGTDLLSVLQHYYTPKHIKRSGGTYFVNPCPFCGGSKPGGGGGNDSFSVKDNVFHCFACGKSGSVIDFVMEYCKIASPLDAAKEIAKICGIKLDLKPHSNGKPPEKPNAFAKTHREIFKAAASWYHQRLLNDQKALEILAERRKYSREFIAECRRPMGFSGHIRGELLAYLREKFSDEDLVKSGLISRNDRGELYEYFPPQYIIYFHVWQGQVCDFSAKHLLKHEFKKDDKRRAELYLKGEYRIDRVVYNQEDIKGAEIIFVEGQNDVEQIKNAAWRRWQDDLRMNPNAKMPIVHVIADKNLTNEDFYRAMLRRVQMVYLWYDPDAAGSKFIERWFHKFWGEFPIKVIYPGSGTGDPDEYLRKHPDAYGVVEQLKKNSVELFTFLVSQIEETDDTYTNVMRLKPFTDRFLKTSDSTLVSIAIDAIKSRFTKTGTGKIIEQNYKKEVTSQAASGASKKYLPYFEHDGIYFRRQGESKIGLSNFIMRIRDIIRMDDLIYYRCELINDQGEVAEDIIFDAADRTNVRKFKERCATKGAYYFTGKDSDLAGIWQLEESRQQLGKTYYIQHYGWIESEKLWLFDNCAIKDGKIYKKDDDGFIRIANRNYKPYNVLVYSGATPKLNIDKPFDQSWAQQVADNFHTVMDIQPDGSIKSYKGYLFFGFLPAVLYSNEIYNRFGFFPFLFSYGPSGTGKTQLTSRLLECFGFITSPESWPGATEPGTYQFLQSLCSLPCWYDEFLNDKTFEKLLGTIKNIYNRTGSGKGGLEKRTIRQVNGAFWLSGEDNPNNEAVLSRSVVFRFDPINKLKTKAYNWLTDHKKDLSVLAREIILKKSDELAEEYLRRIDEIATYIIQKAEKIDFRVAMNHAIPAAGVTMMVNVPEDFLEYVVQHAAASYQHKLTESPVYQFFSELSYLYNRTPYLDNSVRYDASTGKLAVHFTSAIKIIQKELRQRGEQLKIKPDSVRDYLKDLDGCDATGERIYFNNGLRLRCMIFDLAQLPENIRHIAEFEEKE